jgi:hypothetical protein
MKISLKNALNLVKSSPRTTFHLEGNPGCGKTQSLLHTFKQTHHTIFVSAPNVPAEDLAQLPTIINGETKFAPNSFWKPHETLPTAIIIDELTKAEPDTLNALLPVLHGNPRTMHGYSYGSELIVVSTGNPALFRASDRMPTHVRNRMTNLDIADPSTEEAVEVMLNCQYDPRIIGFVKQTPAALTSYDPMVQSKPDSELTHYFGYRTSMPDAPFCSMRSLQTASNLLQDCGSAPVEALEAALAGSIGQRAASALSLFAREIGEYIVPSAMVKDPKSCKIPANIFDQRMAALGAASYLTPENAVELITYVKRMHPDIQGVTTNL